MNCEAVIGTALRNDGSTALPTLGSSPPLRLMPTPDGVYVVGAAAAPLNGDRIALEIFVAPGTELVVRTVAASLAWPGTSPVPSQFTIEAHVGEDAVLHWLPEPLVPIAGSVHRVAAQIDLAAGAELVWREEIVLGRHNEAPGELSSQLSISTAGGPLLRQELVVGAAHHESPPILGDARATGSVTIAGRRLTTAADFPLADDRGEAAILELEGGGAQIVATAADSTRLRKLLDRGMLDVLGGPLQTPTSRPAGSIPRSQHATLGS